MTAALEQASPHACRREVDVAEVYAGRSYLMLRNEKTEKVVAATKRNPRIKLFNSVQDFASYSTLLDALSGLVKGAAVVVTFGDSTTTNHQGWPRKLAWQLTCADRKVVVVNLAHWNTVILQHLLVLESFLAWLQERGPASTHVVVFGGIVDLFRRHEAYAGFMRGRRSTPLLASEVELARFAGAGGLPVFDDEVPLERADVDRWIGRRTFAAFKVFEKICAAGDARYVALLQPVCYPDLAPRYAEELFRYYSDESEPLTFEQWCNRHGLASDASMRFGYDLRPSLSALLTAWHRHQPGSENARYLDCAALFARLRRPGYVGQFDAVHYDGPGQWTIASALVPALGLAFSAPSRVAQSALNQTMLTFHRDFVSAAEVLFF